MECRLVVWERMWLSDPDERMKLIEHECSTDKHLTCSEDVIKTNSIVNEEHDVSNCFIVNLYKRFEILKLAISNSRNP